MSGIKLIEKGYKKYQHKAQTYFNSPEKTEKLVQDASKKASTRKPSLIEVWDKLQLLLQLVTAWRKGEYRKIPTGSLLTILASILYFVSPIDLIPDFLAGIGILDDAAVLAFVYKQISADLEKFKAWKESELQEPGRESL